jgi:hypothetical protein
MRNPTNEKFQIGQKYSFQDCPTIVYQILKVEENDKIIKMMRITNGGGIFADHPWYVPFSDMDLFVRVDQ